MAAEFCPERTFEKSEEIKMVPPKDSRFRDLTGQRFGKLVALSPTEKRTDGGSVVWRCQCDCGKFAEVSGRRLVCGKVRSCGCLSNPPIKDYVGKRFGRLIVLEYVGKKRKITEKSAVTIHYWKCRCDCGNEIIVGQTELQNGDTQSCGCLQKEQRVREALELCDGTSVAILERSKERLRRSNTSGHTGVSQAKDGKWTAYINFKKKRYWLGRYENKEDAIRAREEGEEMHNDFLVWYHREIAKNVALTETEEAPYPSPGDHAEAGILYGFDHNGI